ncbi:MAG: DUF192 domain-containing protein [Candidatus Riflebacteria bacterium]|nr:DUF192 domain-containing protein [Candidatus Riflebacteria bacterium]
MKRSSVLIIFLIFISFFCLACKADSETVTAVPIKVDQTAGPVETDSTPGDPAQTSTGQPGKYQVLPETVASLAGHELRIMLARSFEEKALGLMYYERLAENLGMLFVYPAPRSMAFWMKNTMIPLDLIFLSENLEISEMIENMEPGYGLPEATLPRYVSTSPAQYALELNAGMIKKLDLKIGDRLEIPITLLYSD